MKQFYFLDYLYDFTHNYLSLYTLRDALELTILSVSIYIFLRWLNSDKNKKPLLWFHAYWTLIIMTYYAQLTVIALLLLMTAPIGMVLLIIMHQHILQKNYIVRQTIKTLYQDNLLWLDELMRACLSELNTEKEVIVIIQRNHDLSDLLEAPYILNADLKKEVLDLLLEHNDIASKGMVWVHTSGKIVSINAHSVLEADPIWLTDEIKNLPRWKQDLIFITHKTDALIFYTSVHTRLFTCIIQGKAIEELTAAHALDLLKRYMTNTTINNRKTYPHAYSKDSVAQQQLN